MKHYVVRWCIDAETSNPLEAIQSAIKALPHEGNEDTIATIFEVDELEDGKVVKTIQIDVLETGCNPFDEEDLKNFDETKIFGNYELEPDGQDRESYTDDQDRESYTVTE